MFQRSRLRRRRCGIRHPLPPCVYLTPRLGLTNAELRLSLFQDGRGPSPCLQDSAQEPHGPTATARSTPHASPAHASSARQRPHPKANRDCVETSRTEGRAGECLEGTYQTIFDDR